MSPTNSSGGRIATSTGSCASWYLDATGRNSALWPDYTFNYRRLMDTFELGDYELLPAGEGAQPRAEPVPA